MEGNLRRVSCVLSAELELEVLLGSLWIFPAECLHLRRLRHFGVASPLREEPTKKEIVSVHARLVG